MRKALMGLVLAATVMTPIAVQAQDGGGRRAEMSEQDRAARQAARAERQAQRAERQAQAAPVQQDAAVAQQREYQRQQMQAQRQQNRGQRRQDRSQQYQGRQYQAQQQQQQILMQQQLQAQQEQANQRNRVVRQRQSVYPNAWQGNPNDPARARYEELERRNQYRYGTRDQRRDVRQEYREERREDRRDYRQDRRQDRRDWRNQWNRQAWRQDRRYDWQRYRYSNRNLYRQSPYYSPYRNYGYSRFSIGLILQPLFYSQRYWINDPYQYRLPYAPEGTRWVRYYNDVLLVDTWSGEVVDVIYDFFW